MHASRRLSFAIGLVIAGCTSTSNAPAGPASDAIAVTASTGIAPAYAWTGTTAVTVNVVRTSAPTTAVWGVASMVSRSIPSGSQHGVVPPGATETAWAERALTKGVTYRVTVSLADGKTGFVDFTP